MAVIESNQMRRAHRVDIPLTIVIAGIAYHSKDWSMTGVGVGNLNLELNKDEVIDASLVLALQEAKLEIPVRLQFKIKRGSISGFEFAQISEKNKRVLREFLELSIEGKLDQVDGLLSIYNEPIIDTPIKESVMLSDEEDSTLKQAFVKRSKLYIKLGVIFFLLLVATIYYNTSYVFRSIGTVSGNFVKISPGVSGKLKKIDVKVGDTIHKKDLLFELDDKMTLNQIDIIDGKLADLDSFKSASYAKVRGNEQVLNLLSSELKRSFKSYKSAKELYESRLISINDFRKVEDAYSRIKVKYLQEKNRYDRTGANSNNNSSIMSLITQLQLRREELINKLNYLRVVSQTDGRVYAIKANVGSYVGSSDEVMVIETNRTSFVVCKLKQEEAVRIQNGMKVKVYSSSTNKTYPATIQTVGNLALNTESEVTNEVSLKEVTVKVVFDDKRLRLPLNERVKVWFYRPIF